MEAHFYRSQFAIEDTHWWYCARRKILTRLLTEFSPAGGLKILEIGCGGGGNLPLLSQLGATTAVEMKPEAVNVARAREVATVAQGKLGDAIPVLLSRYHIVGMFDVLEHIEDDAKALQQVRNLLLPGGRFFVTVPAYMGLWSRHDIISHHYRRYSLGNLIKTLTENGFRTLYASYFNTVLFPIAAATLIFSRVFSVDPENALGQPPTPINILLEKLFAAETWALPRMTLPFGLSIVLVAEPQG